MNTNLLNEEPLLSKKTTKKPKNIEKALKIVVLFALISLLILIFVGKMFTTAMGNRITPSTTAEVKTRAKRGAIISADGFHIATTHKLYKAIVNTKNIDPDKKELFINLFSIYTTMSKKEIADKLESKRGSVTLSYSIHEKNAKLLRTLGHKLLHLKVFKKYSLSNGRTILHGLDILESGATRQYAYDDLLTPIIGYIHKYEEDDYTQVKGVKGVEKSYEGFMEQKVDGFRVATRDVNNYLILNKKSRIQAVQNGPDIELNIPVSLQRRAEHIASLAKKRYGAKEVMCAVMESTTGKIITLATSNRFLPKSIRKQDYPYLKVNAIEYLFEPGSVMKSLVFAKLLEAKKINPYDVINVHNGRYKIGRKVITDEHEYAYLSAENCVVHSSNIGMAQMVQKMGAIGLNQAFVDFGLSEKSGIDLPYERVGYIPSITKLTNKIYKATVSYGYGLSVNFMQLLRAYNVFNDKGLLVTPAVVSAIINHGNKEVLATHQNEEVLAPSVAKRMKQILIKTVKEGTGKAADVAGLEVGGKTGTARIAVHGKYVRKYNSSFFGFANDASHNYTIGVTVIQPNRHYYFGALSSAPVFKSLVELLVEFDFLHPNVKSGVKSITQ